HEAAPSDAMSDSDGPQCELLPTDCGSCLAGSCCPALGECQRDVAGCSLVLDCWERNNCTTVAGGDPNCSQCRLRAGNDAALQRFKNLQSCQAGSCSSCSTWGSSSNSGAGGAGGGPHTPSCDDETGKPPGCSCTSISQCAPGLLCWGSPGVCVFNCWSYGNN